MDPARKAHLLHGAMLLGSNAAASVVAKAVQALKLVQARKAVQALKLVLARKAVQALKLVLARAARAVQALNQAASASNIPAQWREGGDPPSSFIGICS